VINIPINTIYLYDVLVNYAFNMMVNHKINKVSR